MTAYALRLQNGTDTAARMRFSDALGLTPGSTALSARSALRRDGGGAVTVVAGTMSVQVTPFAGWVDGGTSDAQAGYPFVADATTTLTLADGDAIQARVDTIVARVRDNAFDGSGETDATVVVVTGIPGAGAPTLPASCIPLRNVNVPAGLSAGTGGLASGHLSTDRRQYLGMGVVPVGSSAERDALPSTVRVVYRLDTGQLEKHNGTAWKVMQEKTTQLVQAGTATVDIVTAGASASVAVVFPVAFDAPPKVTLTADTTTVNATVAKSNVTATGFTARAGRSSGTLDVDLDWIAVGTKA